MRFRSLFLTELKKLHGSDSLFLPGTGCENPVVFQRLIDSLFSTEWVVYLKESFQGRDSVIEYLARYTHRIAISNHRILSADNGMVQFTYRDYKDGNKEKTEHVDTMTFMRRFMFHVVPYRFVRIRYFGILSHRNKSRAISACRDFYNVSKPPEQILRGWRDIFLKKTGRDCARCPACERGRLVLKESLSPVRYRAPPSLPVVQSFPSSVPLLQ